MRAQEPRAARRSRIAVVSAHGIFTPPAPANEPVLSYAPAPRSARAQARIREMESQRIHAPLVIGGRDVPTDETFDAVMPHRKSHVLADVAKEAEHVQRRSTPRARRTPTGRARRGTSARRSSCAPPNLAGPWRQTVNAATMLNQSKTAHQAEIDAACELIDFWRYNAEFLVRVYSEQPYSPTGTWNRMEYRPLEGFVSR